MAHVACASKRRRRAVCAGMGVLEDVRGSARDGRGSANAMTCLGRFIDADHHEDALSVIAELVVSTPYGFEGIFSSRRAILLCIKSRTAEEALRFGETFIWTLQALGEEHKTPS